MGKEASGASGAVSSESRRANSRGGRCAASGVCTWRPLVLGLIACVSASMSAPTPAADWMQFGWDVSSSGAPTDETGITAANLASLQRHQVTLDGTVDASAIYLHDIKVNGVQHDVFFVT